MGTKARDEDRKGRMNKGDSIFFFKKKKTSVRLRKMAEKRGRGRFIHEQHD